jgi:hypothetical protein
VVEVVGQQGGAMLVLLVLVVGHIYNLMLETWQVKSQVRGSRGHF